MNNQEDSKIIAKKIGILCIVATILSIGTATFFTAHLWDVANIRVNLLNIRIWKTVNRAYILFFFLLDCILLYPLEKCMLGCLIKDGGWE